MLFPQKAFLRILVGVDGSESSFKAADNAISFAKLYGSELIVIHVIPLPSTSCIFYLLVRLIQTTHSSPFLEST